jgi:hypothetical protein
MHIIIMRIDFTAYIVGASCYVAILNLTLKH